MSTHPASKRRWPRISGLALTGFGLVLALLAVVLVQARQFALLRQAVQAAPEYSMSTVYQAEFEYQRLLDQWQQATDDRRPLDQQALQLRYDIWVSRLALLQSGGAARLVNEQPEDMAALQQARDFVAHADRALGNPLDASNSSAPGASQLPLTREFLQAALPQLQALGRPFHTLTLQAARQAALQAEQRTEAVREQNTLGLGLTVFLSLLTLAFALVAVRQLRRARQRRLELEQLALRLTQAQRAAESANAAKSEFLAHMSHEVRTPFHGLMGMLSLLRETGLAPAQQAYLRTATESADHLLAVLNDILDLSQLESGQLKLAPVAVDLRALVHEVEALVRPLAVAKSLAFHLDISPDIPEFARLDALRVRQILFNLLSNAIKFTDRGAAALELRQRATGPEGEQLEFCVSDTGAGMDAVTLAALFDRSHRGHTHHAGQARGAGLGLEISRKLARAMGGDITVRSQPGQGSSFALRLPLVAATRRQAEPAAAQRLMLPTRSLVVLVAEDHPVNRQYMEELLRGMGHTAAFAANGEEAVAAARDKAFDLVLMDLHMPALDGVGATRAIRALPDTAKSTVPIVALTADAFEETRDRCVVAGMNGFLSKPVRPDMLSATLRRLFGPVSHGGGHRGQAGDPEALNAGADTSLTPANPAHAATPPGAAEAAAGATVSRNTAPPAADAQPATAAAQDAGTPPSLWVAPATAAGTVNDSWASSDTLAAPANGAATPSAAQAPVLVDQAAIHLLLQALSPQQYSALAQHYFDQAPQTCRRLRAAVRDGQPLDLRTNAHAAKGAALNLGFAGLAATAQALQQGASHLPAHEIARLVQRFDDQIVATREVLLQLSLLELQPAGAT